MNIFVLDLEPTIAARYHANMHVNKQLTEAAQMLSTAVYCSWPNKIDREEFKEVTGLCKPCYINHPATKWARESRKNFLWLLSLGYALSVEFGHRFGKLHGSTNYLTRLVDYSILIPRLSMTEFVQCMPEQYRIKGQPVKAYRDYYLNEKKHLMHYTKREPPIWSLENVVELR